MKVFYSLKEAAKQVTNGPFYLAVDGQLFPLTWRLNGSSQCVVFCPGATSRDILIPSFQRSSYFQDLQVNCISIFDPTLYHSASLTIGWFQGAGGVFYAELLSQIMQSLPDALGINGSDVLIYGSSAGGISGFHVASSIRQSKLYVSNIQTDVSKYHERLFSAMRNVSYPGLSSLEVFERYAERLSIIGIDGEFELFYSQNLADEFHYKKHFLPYQGYGKRCKMKTHYYQYYDVTSGHNPLPRETELEIIRYLLAGQDITALFPNDGLQASKSNS